MYARHFRIALFILLIIAAAVIGVAYHDPVDSVRIVALVAMVVICISAFTAFANWPKD